MVNVLNNNIQLLVQAMLELQSWTNTTTKNGAVLEATSNVKLFLETIWLG